ncbi:MAG: class I tRNA ligase family protein, partial [Candidatus Omnitrophota bacterium]
VLEKFLRVMHPFMPFITEEIWHKLPGDRDSIMLMPWPHLQEDLIDKKTESKMAIVFEAITTIRMMRSELKIPLQNKINAGICVNNKAKKDLFLSMDSLIRGMSRLESLNIAEDYSPGNAQYVKVLKGMTIVIPLSGVIDVDKLRKEKEDEIKKVESEIKAKKGILSNENFVKRAPKEIVDKEKIRLEELKKTLQELKGIKDGLK